VMSRTDDDTTVDAPALSTASDPATGRRLTPTAAESDPPTSIIRRDDFIELPPGSVVCEIYEIDAKLGAGAMGEVYAARHVKLGKRVAIKVIGPRLSEDTAAIERFSQEAQTLAQIQHPAIVAVEHIGELADGRAFFVMEFLRGESLFERLTRGRVPLPEALRILDQMARGLEAAHAHGVTHRDLKPENVFLVHLPGEAPIVKLVDFGLSKLAADADRRVERTQSGVAIGTPMYMSPEQMRGPHVDYRTDIYALGCVAYELLLGCEIFPHAKTAPALYAAHLHEAPPLPRSIWPEIPPQLDLVLFAMLAKDPAHRPTLAQVRAVVEAVRTSTPSQRAATEIVAPRATKTKTRTLMIAAAALIGGITLGAAVTSRSSRETTRDVQVTTPAGSATIEHVPALVPPAPTATIAAPRAAPAPRPRNMDGSGAASRGPHTSVARPMPPKITAAVSTDGGLDAALIIDPPPPVVPEKTEQQPNKPVDRNQTVNPFATKRTTR
jgi:serine/threonine protein kinase